MVHGHERREVVELRRTRMVLTMIYNTTRTKAKDVKKDFEIMPLPGDEARIRGKQLMSQLLLEREAKKQKEEARTDRSGKE